MAERLTNDKSRAEEPVYEEKDRAKRPFSLRFSVLSSFSVVTMNAASFISSPAVADCHKELVTVAVIGTIASITKLITVT